MNENIKVVILDVDDTIVGKWGEDILPGRRAKLAQIREQGKKIFLATNQGGPAYRMVYEQENSPMASIYPSLLDVTRRLYLITLLVKAERCYVALHPGEGGVANKLFADMQTNQMEEYAFYDGRISASWRKTWRKPEKGMIWEIMKETEVMQAEALYVGNAMTDLDAARNAGIPYAEADEFFWKR